MERNQKNIEKTQKIKTKKKQYLETLGGTPPSPRPLEYCFFFCFVPIPPIPKTSGILFFFVFSMLLLVCAIPPLPQDL